MGYWRSSCSEKSSLSIRPGRLDAEVTLVTLSSFTSTRLHGSRLHLCAVARTNFLERSTQEISAFPKGQSKQRISFTFTSRVFTLEKQPQSGQEKRYVLFLNQGLVFLASPAMAQEQDALYTQGFNPQTGVTPSKKAAKSPWPRRLLLLAGHCFQLHFIIVSRWFTSRDANPVRLSATLDSMD